MEDGAENYESETPSQAFRTLACVPDGLENCSFTSSEEEGEERPSGSSMAIVETEQAEERHISNKYVFQSMLCGITQVLLSPERARLLDQGEPSSDQGNESQVSLQLPQSGGRAKGTIKLSVTKEQKPKQEER